MPQSKTLPQVFVIITLGRRKLPNVFHPNKTLFFENLWFLENLMTMVLHIALSRIKSTDT